MPELTEYSGEIAAGTFALLLAIAAIWDMAKARIPNFIPILMIAGFLVAAFAGASSLSWGSHLAAAGITLVVTVPLFQLGWMGGGDVKLLITAALWLGLGEFGYFGLYTALAGGALAVLLLSFRPVMTSLKALPVINNDSPLVERLSKPGKIPYGVAIAIGGLFLVPEIQNLYS